MQNNQFTLIYPAAAVIDASNASFQFYTSGETLGDQRGERKDT